MATTVIHIAGLDIQVGSRLRQRCAWCEAVIEDRDLAREQVPVEQAGDRVRGWPPGELVSVTIDGGAEFKAVIDHPDGEKLPKDCCALLDPDYVHDIVGDHL
jgi:hypothetical protein